MSRTIALYATGSCVLDGDGNGTAECQPSSTSETWTPQAAAVSASSNSNEATCSVYAGNSVSPAYLIGATSWGSTGDSTANFAGPVHPGQSVWAQWAGGDPGATATLVVTGTRTVP
jgi:hypothetical protein